MKYLSTDEVRDGYCHYLFLKFGVIGEKTLHYFILGRHFLSQLSNYCLGLTEHDLLDDVVVSGVVEEEIVDNRPACCRATGEGAAWLAPTHVQTPQELEPEAKILSSVEVQYTNLRCMSTRCVMNSV